MEVLSEILSICRSERAVTARFELSAPWGLSSRGVDGATIIRMARGAPWWIQVPGAGPARRIEAGDLVMLSLGAPHRMTSAPEAPVVPFAQLLRQRTPGARDEAPLQLQLGGGGQAAEMVSVLLWVSAYCRHSVLRVLPPLVHLRADELAAADCLTTTMEALVKETLDQRPGWRATACRMGDLLLIHLLREHLLRAGDAVEAGWWRGLSDPALARAIAAVHRDPGEPWSVETLARAAAMSRSRFSERFRALVGRTPMDYLWAHRMALAAEQLEAGHLALAQVAANVGYESDKVFARAFRRWAGQPPMTYVRQQAERRASLGK